MRYVKPHFYDEFKCIADKCPDTCCAGWQIVIDEDSLEKYAACKDAFGKHLKNCIDWQEGCFFQNNRRCAMLNDSNLCNLMIEKGEGWLCRTCDQYPRHTEEFDGVREVSLSLSCPVAAEIMLKEEAPLRFVVNEDDEPDPLEDEFEDFDYLLYSQLVDAREEFFKIAQNRSLSIWQRLAIITDMARSMQTCVDEGRACDIEIVAEECKIAAETEQVNVQILSGNERYEKVRDAFSLFYELEHLREEWPDVLAETEKTLYDSYDKYAQIVAAFEDEYVAAFGAAKWEIFLEQILMFFLYTYFCGAVYDECVFSKAALAAFSVCYIREIIMGKWYTDGKNIDVSGCITLAYRYAREVEHSDINLNHMEEWFMERFDHETGK